MTLRRIGDRGFPPLRAVALVAVLGFLSLAAWAVSSPVGSSPDDDFHLASIWCGVGERTGLCEPGDSADEREVARDLVIDSVCYAYEPTASAACQGRDFGVRPDDTVSTPRGNFEALYPPLYYFVDGLFAGDDISVSVVAMRLFNSLLFVLLVTAAYLLLPSHRRGALLGGLVLTMVPLGMFIVASTNPSGWAVLSAALLWVTLLGYFESVGWRRVGLGAVATVAAVIGSGARADSAIWALVGIGVATFMAIRRERRFVVLMILPVVLAGVAVAFYLAASQAGATVTGLAGEPPRGPAWIGLFLANLINVPQLWVGAVGGWGLGWLDTAMPHAVWVGTFGVLVGAVALALSSRDRRSAIAMLGLLALLFLVPAYILTQSNALVGGYVQPRYILPLLLIFVGVAVLQTGPGWRPPRSAVLIGLVTVTLANSLALYVNIRRYVTGIDTFALNLDSGLEWWWAAMPSPMAVWILGSLAFAATLTLLARPLLRRATPSESPVAVGLPG